MNNEHGVHDGGILGSSEARAVVTIQENNVQAASNKSSNGGAGKHVIIIRLSANVTAGLFP